MAISAAAVAVEQMQVYWQGQYTKERDASASRGRG
jgi:hypothetical protein